ncbi:Lrp/AsnC family transcriptional regulator, partial [Vibrio parahaemolyticus]
MDRFDERILQVLKRDGRISNVELSERVGLSPSATLRRVQDLERKGVIKGYRAVLDNQQLGVG